MMRIIIAAFAAWLAAIGGAVAQDAVPTEMMLRTWFIHPKGSKEAGSAFTLDYKGRIYLITARHVVEGVPATDAELEVRRSQADAWNDYHTKRTLYPSSADVDIAVFETDETVPQPYTITPGGRNDSDHDGMTFGQAVWFIGYPWPCATSLPEEESRKVSDALGGFALDSALEGGGQLGRSLL
jgi:hypothetical protein